MLLDKLNWPGIIKIKNFAQCGYIKKKIMGLIILCENFL